MPANFLRVIAMCLVTALFAVSCDDGSQVQLPEGDDQGPGLRIVSLSPALTQMIEVMDGGSAIVGVDDSHEQVFPNLDKPTVGSYSQLRTEMIIGLRPTHVVTLAGQEGPPEALTRLAETAGFKLVTFPYPTSVRDVRAIMIGEVVGAGAEQRLISERSIAGILGNDSGFMTANDMLEQLGRIGTLSDRVATPGRKPRVLLVFALEPRIQASGPETVLHDVLTQYAGGYNAAIPDLKPLSPAQIAAITDPEKRREAIMAASEDPAKKVGPAPTFDRERLLEAKPDVILLLLPGAPPLKPISEDPRLANLRGLDIPAVTQSRVVLIDDATVQLPGVTLPVIAAKMTKAIYPELAEEIDALLAPVPEPQPTVDELK